MYQFVPLHTGSFIVTFCKSSFILLHLSVSWQLRFHPKLEQLKISDVHIPTCYYLLEAEQLRLRKVKLRFRVE